MNEEVNQAASPPRLSARVNSSCFACGADNPRGLRLQFEPGDQGKMSAAWTPDGTLEGFDGIIHGGLVSTVLDESMAKAVIASGAEALTVELRVRFRRPVAANAALRVSGWVTERNKRMLQAEAALTDADGTELAHGWASFLVLR
ncbi:MAG TPA: PaaI family thioesterase [Terracidiphilus sp.]|nr:PaaI family thioesterase [Terracidiphilus sp.]